MENVLFNLFSKKLGGFDQNRAGYYTSILWVPFMVQRGELTEFLNSGFLNLITRPVGGYLGDVIYRKYGTKGKKFLTLFCGIVMGVGFLAGGVYLQNNHAAPHLPECEPFFI
jgi:NNP family nitrate/nitrite transporter-like MFS transporter